MVTIRTEQDISLSMLSGGQIMSWVTPFLNYHKHIFGTFY